MREKVNCFASPAIFAERICGARDACEQIKAPSQEAAQAAGFRGRDRSSGKSRE
jgi:hypothetical protein